MQTINHQRRLRAFSANDPRVVRVSNHRDPQWLSGPHRAASHAGDRAVGIVLAICGAAIVAVLLSERYGIDLIAGAM